MLWQWCISLNKSDTLYRCFKNLDTWWIKGTSWLISKKLGIGLGDSAQFTACKINIVIWILEAILLQSPRLKNHDQYRKNPNQSSASCAALVHSNTHRWRNVICSLKMAVRNKNMIYLQASSFFRRLLSPKTNQIDNTCLPNRFRNNM